MNRANQLICCARTIGLALLAFVPEIPADKPFAIIVVDEQTNRGVPLVELQTVNNIRYYTDSNGVAAFDEPGLMNETVFFSIKSHGYEFPKDGFGYRGKTLTIKPMLSHSQLKVC